MVNTEDDPKFWEDLYVPPTAVGSDRSGRIVLDVDEKDLVDEIR